MKAPVHDSPFAKTSEPPYYAVIFTSQRTAIDEGYDATSDLMVELALWHPGFLGIESARNPDGFGITVSYWSSLESIAAWRAHVEHRAAQDKGRRIWYRHFELRTAKVERARRSSNSS